MAASFALDRLTTELRRAGVPRFHYVIFGSAVMFLHGLKDEDDVGDVDFFLRRREWGSLMARPGWKVQTPRADDPPLLELPLSTPLHAFYDWPARDSWMDVAYCFGQAEEVKGYRCIPLSLLRHHKREAYEASKHVANAPQDKHLADLELLK